MTDSWTRSQMLKVALKHPLTPEQEIKFHGKGDVHQKSIIERNKYASKEFIDHQIEQSPNNALLNAIDYQHRYQNFSADHFHKLMNSDRVSDRNKEFLAHSVLMGDHPHLQHELTKYTDHPLADVSKMARVQKERLNDSNSESR